MIRYCCVRDASLSRRFALGRSLLPALILALCTSAVASSVRAANAPADDGISPHVEAENAVEAGRYLAIVSGCNDCHTEGYLQTEGKVPEADWLAGSHLGWRGPWGTTYPANLRRRVGEISEDDWVRMLQTRHANPPMPWMNVNRMSDRDARSLYKYLAFLGPRGEHVPAQLPPGQEPTTPYISLEPHNVNPGP